MWQSTHPISNTVNRPMRIAPHSSHARQASGITRNKKQPTKDNLEGNIGQPLQLNQNPMKPNAWHVTVEAVDNSASPAESIGTPLFYVMACYDGTTDGLPYLPSEGASGYNKPL